jgi:hypothetical protein
MKNRGLLKWEYKEVWTERKRGIRIEKWKEKNENGRTNKRNM